MHFNKQKVQVFWMTAMDLEMLQRNMKENTVLTLISGMGEPGGLPSMGLHRVGHNWSDLAAAVAAAKL